MKPMNRDHREYRPSLPVNHLVGFRLLLFVAATCAPVAAPIESHATPSGPVPFMTLDKGLHGEFRELVIVVAQSPAEWDSAMAKMERERALWVVPGRPAPDGVEWGAVLLIATGGGNVDVVIRRLYCVAGRLCLEVDFPYLGFDDVEYSTYHLVKFEAWEALKSMACSGPEASTALLAMVPHEATPPPQGREHLGRGNVRPGLRITATANPSTARIELSGSGNGPTELLILTVDGRRVTRLVSESGSNPRWSWDGRSTDGRPVPPGIYYACVDTPEGRAITRLVRVR